LTRPRGSATFPPIVRGATRPEPHSAIESRAARATPPRSAGSVDVPTGPVSSDGFARVLDDGDPRSPLVRSRRPHLAGPRGRGHADRHHHRPAHAGGRARLRPTIVTAGLVDDPWDVDDYLHDLTEITTFGTVDDAMVTIEHAYRDRASFSGVTEHGDYFYGADPGMVEWAHAATTWALLASHQRFSATPLNTAESDEYVRQSARIAHLQGARTSPG